MEYLEIEGGVPLKGEVKISGAKNATFPVLSAALLAKGKMHIGNIPRILDVEHFIEILKEIGVGVEYTDHGVMLDTRGEISSQVVQSEKHSLRGTQTLLGALIGRNGRALLPSLGGCNIGTRPIDLHLKGLKQLGVKVRWEEGYLIGETDKLRGDSIYLDFPSVGATENIIIASVLAEGDTVIENAAREPEIKNLVEFLNKLGADIKMNGSGIIKIKGVKSLKPADFDIIPDRIEAATFLIMGAITSGDLTVKNVHMHDFEPVTMKLKESGANIEILNEDSLRVRANGDLKAVNIKTLPYPGFPTDAQPQMMALLSVAEGSSVITETIFENRFRAAKELRKMGADIKVENNVAFIKGVKELTAANVSAVDLRGGASLITAALAARGTSRVMNIYHVDRGYEKIEKKLQMVGGRVVRKKDNQVL
ncbi:MAG: UDP-N-acetylglucosamine 1-carboxyvinyltransferase [Caldisericaceae bacterium]|nr:UDP-N-acetylglucosamine 1-carboxyvinyltransferase [Caldisericaceae bacterium]